MNGLLYFNKKTGELGILKHTNDKDWGSNFAMHLVDPVSFNWTRDNRVMYTSDWIELPKTDPRVQFFKLFDVIYDANWEMTLPEDWNLDEHYILNEHEIFKQIREIFRKG